ncbi:MAG: glycoside hydrolase family 57 protein [Thermoplasmata archaeon]
MKILLTLHMHQPWRLARYRYLDLGSGKPYFDIPQNLEIFRRVADRSYRPTLARLQAIADRHPEFRLSLSMSGTFLEQAELAAPDVLESIRSLVARRTAVLLGESYYHSMAFLLPPPELEEEVRSHLRRLAEVFRSHPRVMRMTELIFSDEIARFAGQLGFRAVLAEGWEGVLGARSPDYLYESASPGVRVIPRHYRLSDDIAFRFSDPGWSEHPLTAEKYAGWIARTPGDVVGLFLDFETFGEHQPASSGIFEFLEALPGAVSRHPSLRWATVEDVLNDPLAGGFHSREPISWADRGRDLGAWLGNDMQRSALDAARKVGTLVRLAGSPALLQDWRRMLTSDHFYYMYVGGSPDDAAVHRYFSSYASPYDAYANYMNALSDLRRRCIAAIPRGDAAPGAH